MAIRNDQIFELLQSVSGELSEVKLHLSRMNGRMGAVETVVRELPCTSHSMDLTILKERVGSHKMNWNRAINIVLAVGQAILVLWLASRVAL